MKHGRAISFDLWGTLIISNPEFKKQQANLITEFSNINQNDWLDKKAEMKILLDYEVEVNSVHHNRVVNYRKLLPNLSENQLADFISYSDELFTKYPPLLREPETDIINVLKSKEYRCYISSNTVFVYGNTLSKIIYDYFGIVRDNCNFSDLIGFSKPHHSMFNFPIKPTWHIGDNKITDGACVTEGIKFYQINQTQNFKTFLDHENI